MKKIATFLFLFTFFNGFSQQRNSIVIEWLANNEIDYGTFKVKCPTFKGDNLNFDIENKQLFYIKKELATNYIDENSLTINNVVYESISENTLGDLDLKNIPTTVNGKISNYIARDKIYAYIVFSPIIKDNSGYKKVISLEYSFNYSNNPNRSFLSNNNTTSIVNSVLSSGNWYRFYVEKSGVYKINKSFLSQLGINSNNLNPKKIKIYGSGGKMVPLMNNVPYPFDLEENAIQVIGEEDGVFDNADYVLFYGEGMDNWSEENKTNLNLYADKAYYYINVEGSDGKRIQPLNQPSQVATVTFTDYDEYQFHEVDEENIGKVGRIWYGENFSTNNEQEFNFEFPDAVSGTNASISIHYGGNSFVQTNFKTTVNGQSLSQVNLSPVTLNSGNVAADNDLNATINSSTTYNVKINYDNAGVPNSRGFLDYIRITSPSFLKGFGKQYRFQKNQASTLSGIGEYQFTNASTINEIWDITDLYNITNIITENQNNFSFKANLGTAKKYLALANTDYYTPKKDSQSKVVNQNIKGTIFKDNNGNFKDVDYLIVTPRFLNIQAEKLANFHRNNSGMNVKVVNLENIYEEFSSGKQDIGAIRNFVKYVYENASTSTNRVKYLNLFGDASFDFKDRIQNNTNIVPIYHALFSNTTGSSSFCSDDFFCYMDPNEGNVVSGSPYAADIASGRMLVSSTQQAEEMVNKVIEYHEIKSYGNWRNNFVAIADDADDSEHSIDFTLQNNQDFLTNDMYAQNPILNYKKIFLDAYVQETTAGGNRYPKAKEEIQNSFEKGALIFNYLGHGGEDGLTGERVWDKLDGSNFNNRYRYPLFITITCDFSKFDNPLRPTGGEYTYWNPKGGAISMITTTRSIGYAFTFNNNLTENLYNYTLNQNLSIAEILRLSKMQSNNDSNTKVALYLGDPALVLAIPRPKVVLTKVNDVPITQPISDFQALAYVKLNGEIRDENDNILSDYNGELAVNIFDKDYNKNTFNNDGFAPPITFTNLGETIFRGNASISNGQFEFGFVVPKDIKIPLGNGRISFYAKRNQILLDKTGYNVDIKVGGIDTNAAADTTPPRVRLYMNDETFVNGGITNESPFFLAFLEDEHGINTASGIGHDIVAILDGDETNPYTLNDYYETELDDYTKGKLRFPFRNLAVGLHTITLKAWDVYNNFITADIQFVVVGDDTVSLTNVLNYPNPFVNYTQFWFTHNRPFEPLDVQVQIFTITGKIVKTINQSVSTEGFLSREITWDGKDDFGDKIGKGVYVYKLTVKSTLTGEKTDKIEKLVIL
jgi:hypothetical protein